MRVISGRFILVLGVLILLVLPSAAQANGGYPDSSATDCSSQYGIYSWCKGGTWLSPRGFGYRNCVDYTAWKVQSLGVPDSRTRGLGHAKYWDDRAASKGLTYNSTPAVGSVAVSNAGDFGHVAFVEAVGGGNITVSEYNGAGDGNYRTRTVAANTFSGFVHFEAYMTNPPATNPAPPVPQLSGNMRNGIQSSLAGRWASGSSGEDFAYLTRRSDGGFDLAVWKQTPGGTQWQGVWWSQPGTSGVQYSNTVLIPADADADGLMDLYYATSPDWYSPGFSVGLMHNTGSGLAWAGTQWSPSSLKLSQTRFIPGDWTGSGRDGFAYVTPGTDNGFVVSVFASTTSGLQWQGVWWDQSGSSGVQYSNTLFMGADTDGNGREDLYYITSLNWSNPGFTVGLQSSAGFGFAWAGTQWAPTGLKLGQTRFIPGDWTGTGREGFAYITPSTDNGFAVAVFASIPGGLQWQGVWWDQSGSSGVQYGNTVFTAVDQDGDAREDLYYTTSPNWEAAGFTMALQHNNGSGFNWHGAQWVSSLPLNMLQFLPQS